MKKINLFLAATILSTLSPSFVKAEENAEKSGWNQIQKEQNNLDFEDAMLLMEQLKAQGITASMNEQGKVVIVKPATAEPKLIFNYAKNYYNVDEKNILPDDHHSVEKFISSGDYEGKENHLTLHVLNNPVEKIVGEKTFHTTESGEILPIIDQNGFSVLSEEDVAVSDIQTFDKELGQFSTENGDKIPTIYDENSNIVDQKNIEIGKIYYSDKKKSTKIIFTNRTIGNDQQQTITAEDFFYAPKSSFGNKQNFVDKNHTFKGNEVTLADAAPGTSAADPNASAGSIVSKAAVDLTHDFSMKARVHLGNKNQRDQGADGIGFTFNPVANNDLGYAGQGFGIGGLTGAFGFKLDTYYNNMHDVALLLNNTGGKKYYDIDPLQYKNNQAMLGELGSPLGNGNGNAFAAFIHSVGVDGTVETITDGAYDEYTVEYERYGNKISDHYTGIEENRASELSPKFIHNPEEFTTHWKEIEFHYTADNKTLSVDYDGKHWSAPLSSLVPNADLSKLANGYKLMISSSTGWGANLHQIAFDNLSYTTPATTENLNWKEVKSITTWNTQKVVENQDISIDKKIYKVSWKEVQATGKFNPKDVFPELVKTPITPTVPIQPMPPVNPIMPTVPVQPLPPVNPITPTVPVQPIPPVNPITPTVPVKPIPPVKPITPTVPVKPIPPVKPITPTVPVKPVQPKPITPTMPVKPVLPKPVTPTLPVNPSQPKPVTPTVPVKPVQPKPITPTVPVKPTQPKPITPTVPVKPTQPKPITPTMPVKPTSPAKPVVPEQPEEVAKGGERKNNNNTITITDSKPRLPRTNEVSNNISTLLGIGLVTTAITLYFFKRKRVN
ncbi:LPXTG-motif cell wall anchor domain-containing protein [Pilibacter termitis]|uniref:LPXTG-motif cell wall anchor domain-containing protein n=1 Tax=Pilibacter termitis TaxID=263852 RepID=A0A1T4L5U0_9ENTE|nr:LPXTG cell wall anchor domain-containing protein [Pilibacter termitis]SJZ49998.1 LPXTG-motif cell wall anchor domain-containing protein [Pilibacter termitis]